MKSNPPSTSFVASLAGMLTAIMILLPVQLASAATLTITAGWNLVGNSVSAPLSVAVAFNNPTNVTTVYKWIPGSGSWAFYSPVLADGGAAYAASKGYSFLTTINAGEGFWVNALQPFTVTLAGTTSYSLGTTDLAKSWNLVATGDTISPAQMDVKMGGITGAPGFSTMWTWNSTGNNWYFYAPSLAANGTLASYIQSKGYVDFGSLTTGNGLGFWLNRNLAAGPAPVNLGIAGNFAILSKTGITDVPTSAVVGDIGTSPITGASILLTCTEVTGKVYSVDAAGPLPCSLTDATRLTTAVGDMETAYTDAAGRAIPDFSELAAGDLSGLTLVPGLYKWGTSVAINTDVTLSGGPNDVWIFQISGNLTLANGKKVVLAGGALPKNIFWQVVGDGIVDATLGTTSHFEGIIISKNAIHLNTGASINGRLLAQKAVTLQSSAVTQPAP